MSPKGGAAGQEGAGRCLERSCVVVAELSFPAQLLTTRPLHAGWESQGLNSGLREKPPASRGHLKPPRQQECPVPTPRGQATLRNRQEISVSRKLGHVRSVDMPPPRGPLPQQLQPHRAMLRPPALPSGPTAALRPRGWARPSLWGSVLSLGKRLQVSDIKFSC